MSTKIYNAYLFGGTLREVFDLKERLQKAYKIDVINRLNALRDYPIASISAFGNNARATRYLEAYKDKTLKDVPYFYLYDILREICERSFHEPLNFDASIVLYQHEDQIILQFFGLDAAFVECVGIIQKLVIGGKLVDFHYQNQTDRPDEITADEWLRREKAWNEIFDFSSKPSIAGFSVRLRNMLFEILFAWNEQKKNKETIR